MPISFSKSSPFDKQSTSLPEASDPNVESDLFEALFAAPVFAPQSIVNLSAETESSEDPTGGIREPSKAVLTGKVLQPVEPIRVEPTPILTSKLFSLADGLTPAPPKTVPAANYPVPAVTADIVRQPLLNYNRENTLPALTEEGASPAASLSIRNTISRDAIPIVTDPASSSTTTPPILTNRFPESPVSSVLGHEPTASSAIPIKAGIEPIDIHAPLNINQAATPSATQGPNKLYDGPASGHTLSEPVMTANASGASILFPEVEGAIKLRSSIIFKGSSKTPHEPLVKILDLLNPDSQPESSPAHETPVITATAKTWAPNAFQGGELGSARASHESGQISKIAFITGGKNPSANALQNGQLSPRSDQSSDKKLTPGDAKPPVSAVFQNGKPVLFGPRAGRSASENGVPEIEEAGLPNSLTGALGDQTELVRNASHREILPAHTLAQLRSSVLEFARQIMELGEPRLLKIKLNPADLGSVEITFERNAAGKVSAHFQTDNESTRHLLTESLAQLRNSLENSGVQVGDLAASCKSFMSNDNAKGESRVNNFGNTENQPVGDADLGGYLPGQDDTQIRLVNLRA